MSLNLELLDNNECIICFENIKEPSKKYKFICNHRDNMHEECIKNLDICPICRSISKYLYESQFNDIEEYYDYLENHNNFNQNNQNNQNEERYKCIIMKEFYILVILIAIFILICYFY